MSDKQWRVSATLSYSASVTVEAETAEEAVAKFEAMDWVDDGHDAASCTNWRATAAPKQCYP